MKGSVHYPPRLRLKRLESREAERYLDLGLVVCAPNGEELYRVGGRWDRIDRRYVGPATRGRKVLLQPSQVDAARWFAAWLDDYRAGRPHDHALMLGGARRGGKSFLAVLFIASMCLETPGAITWIISPTIELREEIERWFAGEPGGRWKGLPSHWYEYRAVPQFRYIFENGSTCRNLSGAIPSRLKRGRCTAWAANEAQEQADSVMTYAFPSVIDTNGLGILAANPPDKPKGQWINGFREKLKGLDEEGRELCGEIEGTYFWIDPSRNGTIDQGLRSAVGDTLMAINEDAAKRDAAGLWLPVGDIAYPRFIPRPVQKGGMIGPPPDTLKDITNSVLRRAGVYGRFAYAIGGDFQGWPFQVAAVWRVFERPEDRKPIYWLVDEAAIEGDETDLSDEVLDLDAGYTPDNAVWIPDATGEMQDGKHSKRDTSFDKLKRCGWKVVPPTEKVSATAKNAVNPRVYRRLALVYRLMEEGRFFIAPHCALMIEAFTKCPLRKGRYNNLVPHGKWSHPSDAAGYPLFKMEAVDRVHKPLTGRESYTLPNFVRNPNNPF